MSEDVKKLEPKKQKPQVTVRVKNTSTHRIDLFLDKAYSILPGETIELPEGAEVPQNIKLIIL